MANSTLAPPFVEPDSFDNPFDGVMETKPSKVFSLTFSCLTIPINIGLLYGIVWFEKYGTDNKRTLINKLVASLCWNLIYLYTLCQPIEIVSYVIGKLPQSVCFANVVLKNASKTQSLLLFDSSVLVQYLLIFWIKNPAAVNDEFWSLFISMWIAGLAHVYNFVKFMVPHRQPLNFYICSGTVPDGDWSLPSNFGAHFEVLTIVTIVCVKLKIHFFKKGAVAVEERMTPRSIFKKKFTLEAIDKGSLTTFTLSLTGLCLFSSFVVLGLKLNKLQFLEMNVYPNYFLYYVLQLILPNLVGLIVSCLFYLTNRSLRESVYAECKSYASVYQ